MKSCKVFTRYLLEKSLLLYRWTFPRTLRHLPVGKKDRDVRNSVTRWQAHYSNFISIPRTSSRRQREYAEYGSGEQFDDERYWILFNAESTTSNFAIIFYIYLYIKRSWLRFAFIFVLGFTFSSHTEYVKRESIILFQFWCFYSPIRFLYFYSKLNCSVFSNESKYESHRK